MMRYFKNASGKVYAYSEQQLDHTLVDPTDDELKAARRKNPQLVVRDPALVELSTEERDELVSPTPTRAQEVARYRGEIGAVIEKKARALGFDGIATAVTYADEPEDAELQALGLALRAWRSKCWAYARTELGEWRATGVQPVLEDVLEGMPPYA